MEKDFEKVMKRMKFGMWKIRIEYSPMRKTAVFNDAAKQIFSIKRNMDGDELFEYWNSHIDSDYAEEMNDFLSHIIHDGVELERQFVWNLPGEPERYVRMKGLIEEKTKDYVVISGFFNDITDSATSWGRLYVDNTNDEKLKYDLVRQNGELIEALGAVVEFRNMENISHTHCVKIFSGILAGYVSKHYPEYGITNRIAKIIANAAPLHDIGKIEISDIILLKPGRLSSSEFELVKRHSEFGAEVVDKLSMMDESFRRHCRDIVLYHHERYDGRGYPVGLSGDEIPISAQIVGLADVYDTLITPRIYKDAYTPKQAYNMILRGECGAFNPKLIYAFSRVREDMERVAEKYKNRKEEIE